MYKSQGKRRHDDDGNGERFKRPRFTPNEQAIIQLRREIVELGEPSRFKLSSMLDHLGNRLGDVTDAEVRSAVYTTLFATVTEQPHKIPLLAGSIIIANARNPTMGQVAVEMTHSRVEEALRAANWAHVKLYMRFVVSLGPIIEADGVERALRDILAKAIELGDPTSSPSSPARTASRALFTGVLLNLANAVACFADSDREPAIAFVSDILRVAKESNLSEISDTKLAQLVSPFRENTPLGCKRPYEAQEWVSLVVSAMDSLAQDGWRLDKFLDIAGLIGPFLVTPNGESVQKHQLPTLNTTVLPENLEKSLALPGDSYPRVFFQAYLAEKFETVPPVGSFESVYFRDICSDVIAAMSFNRREVTRQLITLDLFFSSVAFADPGISFDRLKSRAEDGKSTWKVEDVAVEAVLEHIFRLTAPETSPSTKTVNAYYHSILIESCVMAPQALAPVLGRAFRFLYSNIDSLDLEAYFNYVQWLTHHLSNFNFTWKWNEWSEDLKTLSIDHPRRAFLSNVLQKLERLSYYVRLKETLPQEFLESLPQISEDITFAYTDSEHSLRGEVEHLMRSLRALKEREEHKEDDEMRDDEEEAESGNTNDLDSALTELRDKVMSSHVGGSASEVTNEQINVVFSTVCYLGSRSLSHIESWIQCTAKILNSCIYTAEQAQDNELAAVRSVFGFWKEQPHLALWICQMLVRHKVLASALPIMLVIMSDTTDMNVSTQMPFLTTAVGWEAFKWALDGDSSLVIPVAKMLDAKDDSWWVDGYCRALARRYHSVVASSSDEFAGLKKFEQYL